MRAAAGGHREINVHTHVHTLTHTALLGPMSMEQGSIDCAWVTDHGLSMLVQCFDHPSPTHYLTCHRWPHNHTLSKDVSLLPLLHGHCDDICLWRARNQVSLIVLNFTGRKGFVSTGLEMTK